MRRLVVLFAHPALEHSRVNRRLFASLASVPSVSVRDLYELYPDFDVDVASEQTALLEHDAIVFHYPLYWYSCPPLLKQWIDLVLEHGWAYGSGGTALQGKVAAHIVTAGGVQEAYSERGFNRYTIDEFLRPHEQTARLCGMTYLEPFVVHGTHGLTDDQIDGYARNYVDHLRAISNNTMQGARTG